MNCNRNRGAAQCLAASYYEAKIDIQQMLDHTDINVLHVCTPLSTHVSIAECAMQNLLKK